MQLKYASVLILVLTILLCHRGISASDKPSIGDTLGKIISMEVSNQLTTSTVDLEKLVRKKIDPNFTVKINKDDLQQEGITRSSNEKFYKYKEQSVAAILNAIVRIANPTVHVKDLSDDEQQLVWIIDSKSGEKPVIIITTRKATKTHSYTLPAIFQKAGK